MATRLLDETNELRSRLYEKTTYDLERQVYDFVVTTWLHTLATGYRLGRVDSDPRSIKRQMYWEKQFDLASNRNLRAAKMLLRLYRLRDTRSRSQRKAGSISVPSTPFP